MATKSIFKAEQTPEQIRRAILDRGPCKWGDLNDSDRGPLGVGKLRLVGVYDDSFSDTFMLRTRIPGGRLTSAQLRTVGGVVNDLSLRDPGADAPERFAEITTRQNFQIHWIRFENLPEIWRRFESVGLWSYEACGNSIRNITSCPVDGIDAAAHFEVGEAIDQLNRFAMENQLLSAFLPRKFKVGITACNTDCIVARINCIAFTPARKDGELGFHVHLGGGLSDYPRLASLTNLFVTSDQVTDVVRATVEVFVEFGDFQNSSINRFRALVHELGQEKIESEIISRLGFKPREIGYDLSSWQFEDHIGIHRDNSGTHYVGLSVPLGRLSGDEINEIAEIAERHGDGRIRLTHRQNLVLTGVADVESLLDEPLLAKFSPNPDPFDRAVIACTSAPFCKFAILAMKPYGARLIEHLRSNVPKEGWHRLQGLRIHMSGCKASCAQVGLAHIGLRGTMGKNESQIFDAFDIALGGDAGAGNLAKWRCGELSADLAFDDITHLVSRIARGEIELSDLKTVSQSWSGGSDPVGSTVGE